MIVPVDFLSRNLTKDVWHVVHTSSNPYVVTAIQIINRSNGTGMFTLAFGDSGMTDGQQALDGEYLLLNNNLRSVLYSGELEQGDYYYWAPNSGKIIVPPTAKFAIVISQVDLEVNIFGAEV